MNLSRTVMHRMMVSMFERINAHHIARLFLIKYHAMNKKCLLLPGMASPANF